MYRHPKKAFKRVWPFNIEVNHGRNFKVKMEESLGILIKNTQFFCATGTEEGNKLDCSSRAKSRKKNRNPWRDGRAKTELLFVSGMSTPNSVVIGRDSEDGAV